MLTREEYKETLIRMWDSTRTEYKGDDDCDGVECSKCPVEPVCSGTFRSAYDAIDFVEKWGKEHPIKTNGVEFLKVFPDAVVCDCNDEYDYVRNKKLGTDSAEIRIPSSWWNNEVE